MTTRRWHRAGIILATVVISAATVGVTTTLAGNAAPTGGGSSRGPIVEGRVLAGVHTFRQGQRSQPAIDKWFNAVNGVEPTISGDHGRWLIDFGFSIVDDYAQCTIDSNWVDTRDALCSAYLLEDQVFEVRVWDTGTQDGRPRARNAEFWVLVYGP